MTDPEEFGVTYEAAAEVVPGAPADEGTPLEPVPVVIDDEQDGVVLP